MRGVMLGLGIAAALVALTTPSFSMGGGTSGGGGGSYGTGSGFNTTPSFDDYKVAVRLIKHQQYAEAIPHLNLALADRPRSADILNYLGFTHRMTGDYPGSLSYYKRALAIDADHKGAHEYLGELYLQMNDMASAQAELTTLASLCPSGCDERDMLTKAIAAYVPPAATPTTSGTTPSAAGAEPPATPTPAGQ